MVNEMCATTSRTKHSKAREVVFCGSSECQPLMFKGRKDLVLNRKLTEEMEDDFHSRF